MMSWTFAPGAAVGRPEKPSAKVNAMRLTTKGRFAVTAMIDVALNNGKGPVTLAGVSDRQKLSLIHI